MINEEAEKKETKERIEFEESALFFHENPIPGKLEIQATKPLENQRDLAFAYSPGVAVPCLAIHKNPSLAANYTGRANLLAIISNGSAVLGLGDIGPLASKPVMEGKAVLFKKFAGINVFDLEINLSCVDQMVETICALEPTFGGINLEDIKAPECFAVEEKLKERMKIPVFHDDQHGTAIIVAAAILNALQLTKKNIETVKIVTSGGGAAALACVNLLVTLGAKIENIWITDRFGVAFKGREEEMNRWKDPYVKETDARTLQDVIANADIFLGLSKGGTLKPELLQHMAPNPLILALANPIPEIMPDVAQKLRPDAIICTGRSDFPNQVNNVLCFPYIFRGALDCQANTINEAMKIAAAKAIASLAQEETSDIVEKAHSETTMSTFGPNFLIPSPFDPRLILRIAPAVAQAAAETGVAEKPIQDMQAYIDSLKRFVFRSDLIMKPIFATAQLSNKKRVIFSDGEDERVLRAIPLILEDKIAEPILIGRPQVIEARIQRYGLKISPGTSFTIINPENDPRYREYVDELISCAGRYGISQDTARTMVRTNTTIIAALALKRNEADAMLCGLEGPFLEHLKNVKLITQQEYLEEKNNLSSLSILISHRGVTFFTDAHIIEDPTAEEIAEITILAAQKIRSFKISPNVALLSHSNFGSSHSASAVKMRNALEILKKKAPDLACDGEMNGDSAISETLRKRIYPHSTISGEANLLVFPNLDSANIALSTTKEMLKALHVGPILLGAKKPAHILTPSVTSRGVVNMTAIAVVEKMYEKTEAEVKNTP